MCDNLTWVLPMETTRLSTKGQIILPKAIRDAREWKAGTTFTVEEIAGGVLLRPAPRFPATRLEEVVGCLKHKGKARKGIARTLAQMDAAVGREVKRRHDRGRY